MSRDAKRLPVWVDKTHVGIVGHSEVLQRGASFQYLDGIAQENALSLLMPVRWEAYDWEEGFHPVFRMNMPEGSLKEQIVAMFSKAVRGFDELGLLSIVGPHQLGRLRAGHLDGTDVPSMSVSDLLVHDSAHGLFEDLVQRYARFSGVSGVQPKVLVKDQGCGTFDSLTHKGATHIVKAWRAEDFPQLAANEFFCMSAARHAGLTVPGFELSASGKFLVVERFDIAQAGCLGFEDLCVLSAWVPEKKYDGSYEGCARQLKAFLAPQRLNEGLAALFATVALSAGVRNGDAHLKNFGVMYDSCADDADVWIAPAYDIVSTTVYRRNDIMALEMAGSKNWPKNRILVDYGRRRCNLTESGCRQVLERVADGMSQARAEMIEYMQRTPDFETVGAAMVAEWDRGLERSVLPEGRPTVVDLAANAKRGPVA